MNIDPKLAAREWLRISTDDLCAAAIERITQEVEAHVVDSFNASIARGTKEGIAIQVAISSLGDARKANRKYRKLYLTMRESYMLESGYLAVPSFSTRAVLATLWLFQIAVNIEMLRTQPLFALASILTASLFILVVAVVPWGLGKNRPRLQVISYVLGTSLIGLSVIFQDFLLNNAFGYLSFGCLALVPVCGVYLHRWLRKINNHGRVATS